MPHNLWMYVLRSDIRANVSSEDWHSQLSTFTNHAKSREITQHHAARSCSANQISCRVGICTHTHLPIWDLAKSRSFTCQHTLDIPTGIQIELAMHRTILSGVAITWISGQNKLLTCFKVLFNKYMFSLCRSTMYSTLQIFCVSNESCQPNCTVRPHERS